jgi:hypothetical protein
MQIRTLTFIFLMDSSFVVFNNSPPRTVIQEMTLDLTCPEPCFQASSRQECFSHLVIQAEHQTQKFSLSEAVDVLCRKPLDHSTTATFSRMSILNLFSIVTGKRKPNSLFLLLFPTPSHFDMLFHLNVLIY